MRSTLVLAAATALVATARAEPAPHDFTSEVRALHAAAACGAPPPAGVDAAVVAAHCKAVDAQVATWRSRFRDKAAAFFARQLGKPPSTVVYPFGGGDLVTALVVYPDATEYTTLSLEGMGDPRVALAGKRANLAAQLAHVRDTLGVTFGWAWNTTYQLSNSSSDSDHGAVIPPILTSALVALAANGYEPLEVRYFTLGDDGAIRYVDDAAIDAFDHAAKPTGRKAQNAVQAGLFDDVEIAFRAKADPDAPRKLFRHVTADLSDTGLADHPAALAYLRARGASVAAMTKAASYLLWKPSFATLRDYLLGHAAVIVSDDTGVPPGLAPGFTYKVWGRYLGAHFDFADRATAKQLVALWQSDANQGAIDFRFGYYDNADHAHVMIARPSSPREP
jgi:hypothetical protein